MWKQKRESVNARGSGMNEILQFKRQRTTRDFGKLPCRDWDNKPVVGL